MPKQLTFHEFKQRYESLTIDKNGFGRIATEEDLIKMYVAVTVFRQFDDENNSEKDDVNEREGDHARGN
ncbi:MAG: hypothetical protein ACI35O_10300 [Bacillaceae bacterium]